MEKKCKKAKWLSEEALQIAVKTREVKSKGVKERYTHLNAEFQRSGFSFMWTKNFQMYKLGFQEAEKLNSQHSLDHEESKSPT